MKSASELRGQTQYEGLALARMQGPPWIGGWIGVCGDKAMEGVAEEWGPELGSPYFSRL